MKRRIFNVLAVVAIATMFTGCGCGNSPSSVVEKAAKAILQKNYEEYILYTYNISERDKNRLLQSSKIFWHDPVKFEIQEERIYDNGEKAEVILKYYFNNGTHQKQEIPLVKTSNGWKISPYDSMW